MREQVREDCPPKHMINARRYLFVLLAVPVLVGLVSLIIITVVVSSSREHIYPSADEAPSAEAALILGAGVLRNGGLSPVLRDRVDQAIELYRAGKVEKIIASGDNQTLDYNEVQPILNYLVERDIPKEDIFLDHAGFDTYSSIYRARDVFTVRSLAIVTQSFHLPRAVFIARNLGIEAFGVSADRGHYKLINYFREMLADVKAAANLLFDRRPKYLGEEIPVSGDGRTSQPASSKSIPLW